jgi:hypothetical protein
MFIPDPELIFYPSRIQRPKRHRIPDPQHWILQIWIRNTAYHRDEVRKVGEELLPEHLGHQAQQELVRLYFACNKNATITLYFYFSVEPKSKDKLYLKLLRILSRSSANMKTEESLNAFPPRSFSRCGSYAPNPAAMNAQLTG